MPRLTTTLQRGLVGHWTMDAVDTDSGIAYDRSARSNHGTWNGTIPSPTDGQVSEAYVLDGADISHSSPLEDGDSFSIAMWGRLNSTSDYQVAHGNGGPGKWIEFRRDGSRGISSKFKDTSGNGHELNSGLVANTGVWHHIVESYNGSEYILYVDGEQADSTALSVAPNHPLTYYIGSYGGGNNHTGAVDDVRLYNRGLTAAEAYSLSQMRSNRWSNV